MALALLDVARATKIAYQTDPDSDESYLLSQLRDRKLQLEQDQERFRQLCDRWDNLYFPQGFTVAGSSHWSTHESAYKPGRSHVSLNVYPAYVEIPAAMQGVEPFENMVATDTNEQARLLAAMVERLYFAWKGDVQYELQCHQALITKELYGRVASKVYWDEDEGKPAFEIVDQPRNLYLGWRDSNYNRLEWALYCYSITPQTAMEDWGLRIESTTEEDPDTGKTSVVPYVVAPEYTSGDPGGASWTSIHYDSNLRVEVYDYWYRRPEKRAKIKFGKPVKFETWNAIFVGNVMVKNEAHPEYDGEMPYRPLFNSYLPGVPDGRPAFYDIEQIIREKDEKISENSQMMSRAVNGQYWQLTGPEAPSTPPPGLKPTPNNVITPGAGNRIESISPWMPEFQMDAYLSRLDRELQDASGLNELVRGMAPPNVLNSGKAINALTANYEMRMRMKRDLYYVWRKGNWDLAARIWANKNRQLRPILDGIAVLETTPPTLTPRDDAEAAQIAMTLKEGKLWSHKRAMDRVDVDDPETELDMIRAEQTDATINPASVQVMVTLMATLQQLQMQMAQFQQQAQQMAAPQGGPGAASIQQGLAAQRALAPGRQGSESNNAPEEQAVLPNEQMPANTPEGQALTGPTEAGPSQLLNQFQIREGEAQSRIVGQQTIQRSEG